MSTPVTSTSWNTGSNVSSGSGRAPTGTNFSHRLPRQPPQAQNTYGSAHPTPRPSFSESSSTPALPHSLSMFRQTLQHPEVSHNGSDSDHLPIFDHHQHQHHLPRLFTGPNWMAPVTTPTVTLPQPMPQPATHIWSIHQLSSPPQVPVKAEPFRNGISLRQPEADRPFEKAESPAPTSTHSQAENTDSVTHNALFDDDNDRTAPEMSRSGSHFTTINRSESPNSNQTNETTTASPDPGARSTRGRNLTSACTSKCHQCSDCSKCGKHIPHSSNLLRHERTCLGRCQECMETNTVCDRGFTNTASQCYPCKAAAAAANEKVASCLWKDPVDGAWKRPKEMTRKKRKFDDTRSDDEYDDTVASRHQKFGRTGF
jgi:hypothetical protein